MQRRILIVSILVFTSLFLKAQKTNARNSHLDSIELVKNLMRKDDSVTSYAIGISGKQSNQFQRFLYLINNLNTNDFVYLTKDSSACLRIYAYAGLSFYRYTNIDQVKEAFKKDTTLVSYMTGCLGGNVKTAAIISNLPKWYSMKSTRNFLKEQNKDQLFWYRNFVFHN
ncbi:MAG TPA: hypothetical protein VK484_00420 [Ferruginibacter sp.]|nr:hypothetical protein [Ferruginibacter sp.]